MGEDHRLYWIWMAETFKPGSVLAAKLIRRYGTAGAIYHGAADDLTDDDEFTKENVAKVKALLKAKSLRRAGEILSRCDALELTVLTPEDAEFPAQLKTLRDMPMVLYVRGRMPDCDGRMLTTIVGTRKMSDYGRTIAYSFGAGLAYGGAIVVSGMALGADSMALIGALDAGGVTIAVLGSGVDVIYPAEHKEIYRKIAKHGAVISEYPPGSPPIGSHFPVRNRLMSGISDATVVVEGNAMSGAMITARHALTQGRKLFAVPGNVGAENAEGTNLLLREGAIPAICAEDILCEFEFIYSKQISVEEAHHGLFGMDMDTLSRNAMERTRIGTGTGRVGAAKNYYGSGSYGGRAKDHPGEDKLPPQSAEPGVVPAAPDDTKQAAEDKNDGFLSGVFRSVRRKKEPVPEENTKPIRKTTEKVIPAKKIELDMLDENEIKVYNKMRPSVPMLPDELVDDTMQVSEILSALTMLEMAGAVESGGGGYFMRTSPDDIMQSIND